MTDTDRACTCPDVGCARHPHISRKPVPVTDPDDRRCHYCGTTERELRPYGPGGDPICFSCMKADPSREAAAGERFMALVDANAAVSPVGMAAIDGSERGPIPFDPEQLDDEGVSR